MTGQTAVSQSLIDHNISPVLQEIVESAVRKVIDLPAFEAELAKEREAKRQLKFQRDAACEALLDVDFDELAEDA